MDALDVLAGVMYAFDVDFYTEVYDGETVYVGRLWDDGEEIAVCTGPDLADVIRALDRNASAIANYH